MLYNDTIPSFRTTNSLIIAYYPLFLVIIGTIFNLLTLIILCQSTFNDNKKLPTIYYMRAIAIFDILMLYGWNLDHFFLNVYGFLLQRYSIISCKILSFLNYFSAQSSAWLRVFMCIDRYIFLSHLHRKWFNRLRNVLITIMCVVIFIALFNLHIICFGCFHSNNGTINPNSIHYKIYPLWDYLNLILYNCLPFLLMMIFNSGVIYHLIRLRHLSSIQNSQIQYRAISMTLVLTTCLFLLMTIPATVAYAFFYSTANITVLHLLDSILYTYHILSFPLYLITFHEFRKEFWAIITYTNKKRTTSISSRSLPFVIYRF